MEEPSNKVLIGDKCAEIYTYESQDLVYAMNWSVSMLASAPAQRCANNYLSLTPLEILQNRRDKKFRLAVGSFIEKFDNNVEIITRTKETLLVLCG